MTSAALVPRQPVAGLDHIHSVIRGAGGRLTAPTQALVAVLHDTDAHLTAEDLLVAVERRLPGVAPSTVYRVLQRLSELGVVEHVHTGVGPAFHHLRQRGHAHLVCTECGTVLDIPETAFAELSVESTRTHGFTIDPRHAALLGRCGRCTVDAREIADSAGGDAA